MSEVIVIGPDKVGGARLLALRGALRMEARGMRRGGRSALAIARADGLTNARTAKAALEDVNAYIAENLGL